MEVFGKLPKKLNSEMLFALAFMSLVISRVLFGSTHLGDLLGEGVVNALSNVFLLVSFGLLAGVAYRYQYPKQGLVQLILAFGVVSLSYLTSRASNLFVTVVFLYYADVVIDRKRFVKFFSKFYLGIILFVAALSVTGLRDMNVKQRSTLDAMGYSLGFGHANQVAIIIFSILCIIFSLAMDRRSLDKLWVYLGASVLTAITFLITKSLTFLALCGLLIGSSFCYDAILSKIRLPQKQAQRFIRLGLLMLAAFAALFVVYFWKRPYMLKGSLVTFRARFVLSQKYINAYGIKLFGSQITLGDNVVIPGYPPGYYMLDNGYVRLPVEYGLLASLLVFYMLFRIIRNLINEAKWQLLIIMVCLLLYFFNEWKIVVLFYSPFWILMRPYMNSKRNRRFDILNYLFHD